MSEANDTLPACRRRVTVAAGYRMWFTDIGSLLEHIEPVRNVIN